MSLSSACREFVDGLVPPSSDPDATRRARVLVHFSMALVAAYTTGSVVSLSTGGTVVGPALGMGALLFAVPFAILRFWKNVQLAGHWSCGIVFSVSSALGHWRGGLPSPGPTWLLVATVFSVLVLGPRHSLPWLAYAVGGLVFVAFGTDLRYIDPRTAHVVPLFTAYMASIITVWWLAGAFDKARSESYEALQKERDRVIALSRQMRLVFDHMEQGFLVVDDNEIMGEDRSAIVERWFGPADAGLSLSSYLEPYAPEVAHWLRLGWEMMRSEDLPLEVCLQQLPRRMRVADRWYALAYTPMGRGGGRWERMLVVVSDVTAEVAHQESQHQQRDLLGAFEALERDRAGFALFCEEANRLVRSVTVPRDRASQLRELHTLKGTAAVYGLSGLSAVCHELERRTLESGELLSEGDRDHLASTWEALHERFRRWLGHGRHKLEVSDDDLQSLRQALDDDLPPARIRTIVDGWSLEAVGRPLDRLRQSAEGIAKRLGKAVAVHVDHDGSRVDPRALNWLWSALGHAIRNAIDHGLESEEERRVAGKDPTGHLVLSARWEEDMLVVKVADDGRGIDFAGVAKRAAQVGLPHEGREALMAALWTDGLSTAATANSISGRGVGLAALRRDCQDRGANVGLDTTPGKGTTLTVLVPVASAKVRPPSFASSRYGALEAEDGRASLSHATP